MKAAPNIFIWPEMPALPPPGEPVLMRVPTAPPRQIARRELRKVLREILAGWSGVLPEQLPLQETPRGPVWPGQLGGHSLDISLSYAEDAGWIGLLRAGQIGVDAMPVQTIPEALAVARNYLGHAAAAAIQRSTDPATAFATAWTEFEARLKCLKRELNEWPATQAFVTAGCASQSVMLPDRVMVTVVVRSGSGSPEVSQKQNDAVGCTAPS
jgi:4'-phosphopantetheinyl transferase